MDCVGVPGVAEPGDCRTPRVENLETGNCRKEGGFIRRNGGEGVVCEG